MKSTIHYITPSGKEKFINFQKSMDNNQQINIKTCVIYENNSIKYVSSNEPYSIDDLQLLFSITKSVTALAIGIAVDNNLLQLSDSVIDYISDDSLPLKANKVLKKITIKDMLIMASGIAKDSYNEISKSKDWVKAFFKQDFCLMPSEKYCYSTHGSHVLSVVIENISGLKLDKFIDKYLFQPLEINKYHWERNELNQTTGGMGLSLLTKDLAKIGLLMLNQGEYNGKRIISQKFLKEATSKQIMKDKDLLKDKLSGFYYGYSLHIDKYNNYRMDGSGGQVCLIIPSHQLVLAISSVDSKIEDILYLTYTKLCNMQIGSNEYSPYYSEQKSLFYTNIFNQLFNISRRSDDKNFCRENLLLFEGEYSLVQNLNSIKKISIKMDIVKQSENFFVDMYLNNQKIDVKFNVNSVIKETGNFINDISYKQQEYISFVQELKADKLSLVIIYLSTSYIVKYDFYVEDGELLFDMIINKSFVFQTIKQIRMNTGC